MADPDPRHHADPMNPGLPAPGGALDQEEQDHATASSRRDGVADGEPPKRSAPRSSGAVPGQPEAADRQLSDEDSPGEALARESRGEPIGDIPEPNEPA
jgi:hypothetical protein